MEGKKQLSKYGFKRICVISHFYIYMYRLWAKQMRDSDERGNTRHEYLKLKQDKLRDQLLNLQQNTLFEGLTFLLDGKLEPSSQILKNIIGMCGGNCVFVYSNLVTHVVSLTLSNSSYERYSRMRNIHIVYPKYIIDCNEKQLLLDPNANQYKYCHQNDKTEHIDFNFSQDLMDFISGDQQIEFCELISEPDFAQKLEDMFPDAIIQNTDFQPVSIDLDQIMKNNNIAYNSDILTVISPKHNLFSMQKLTQNNVLSILSDPQSPILPMSDILEFNDNVMVQQETSRINIFDYTNEINQKLDIEEYLIMNRPFGPQPQQSNTTRLYLYIVIDQFYIQVHYQNLSNEEQNNLKNIPMCVCDQNVNKKNIYASDAIILSLNNIAKTLNLTEGMTLKHAYQHVQNLAIFSYNYPLYLAYAKKFYKAVSGISNSIMPISLNRCYVDVTGIINLSVDMKDISTQITNIRQLIKEQSSLNVSVGLGTQLITAASAYQLQNIPGQSKSIFLSNQAYYEKIKNLKIEYLVDMHDDIKNVLYENNLVTVNDICNINEQTLIELVGHIQSHYIKNIVNGIDVIRYYPIKQHIKQEQNSYKVIHDIDTKNITLESLNKSCLICIAELMQRLTVSKQRKQVRQIIIILKIENIQEQFGQYKYEKLSLDLQNDVYELQNIANQVSNLIGRSININHLRQITMQCLFSGTTGSELVQRHTVTEEPTTMAINLCNSKQFLKHIAMLKQQLLNKPNTIVTFTEDSLNYELLRIKDIELRQQFSELLITQTYLTKSPTETVRFIIKHFYATDFMSTDRIKKLLASLKKETNK